MKRQSFGKYHLLAISVALSLGACGKPFTGVTPSAKFTVERRTPTIDWNRLTPNRHLLAIPPTVTKAAGMGVPVGLSNTVIPFYSYGDPGNIPGVYVADLGARTVYQIPAMGGDTAPIGISRTGGLVGVNAGGQLGVLDLNTQLIRVYPQLQNQFITSADVDANGDVAYSDQYGQVHLFDPVTGQDFLVPAAGRGLAAVDNVSLSGNGRFISYSGVGPGGPNIYTTDLATGQQLSNALVSPLGAPVRNIQLSADGRCLLYTEAGQLRVLDYATGVIDNLALLNNGLPVVDAAFLGAGNAQIAFTRNGQMMVYDRVTHLIDTLPIVNRTNGLGLLGARW